MAFNHDGSYGRYLRIKRNVAAALFQKASVSIDERAFRLRYDERAGIELFLLREGVGVLSIAFAIESSDDTSLRLSDVRSVNCRLHRDRHAYEVAAKPNILNLSEISFGEIKRSWPQVSQQPISLSEFRELLIAPIRCSRQSVVLQGTNSVDHALKDSFLVYTVVRFDMGFDLDDSICRKWCGPEIVALRDHWPPDHAGAVAANLPGELRILNRRHYAAVGLEGVAAMIGDQLSPTGKGQHSYNSFRFEQAFEKHFFQYLIALLQRLSLHELRERALKIAICKSRVSSENQHDNRGQNLLRTRPSAAGVRSFDESSSESISRLRDELLERGLSGRFGQLQLSESAHEFYALALRGLRLTEAWEEARGALQEIEDRRTATQSAESLIELGHLQRKVEWVEVFIVGVYALEAMHIMVEALGWKHGFSAGWMLFVVAILAPTLAFRALRPDKKDSPFRFGWLVPLFLLWVIPFGLRVIQPILFETEHRELSDESNADSSHAKDEPENQRAAAQPGAPPQHQLKPETKSIKPASDVDSSSSALPTSKAMGGRRGGAGTTPDGDQGGSTLPAPR